MEDKIPVRCLELDRYGDAVADVGPDALRSLSGDLGGCGWGREGAVSWESLGQGEWAERFGLSKPPHLWSLGKGSHPLPTQRRGSGKGSEGTASSPNQPQRTSPPLPLVFSLCAPFLFPKISHQVCVCGGVGSGGGGERERFWHTSQGDGHSEHASSSLSFSCGVLVPETRKTH